MNITQKTHSANITAGPNTYSAENSDTSNRKRKGHQVISLDCRGLEFTEFKADVCPPIYTLLTRSP